jgi:CO dehydrogenase/acetyl-CoA synthase beta subunit
MTKPLIPGYTCPLIDRVKGAIDQAYRIADNSDSDDVAELKMFLREIRHELLGESDKLEAIRDANLALRNAAEYWKEEANLLASQLN